MDERLFTKLIYENPFKSNDDIKDFILEGQAKFTFPEGRMRMENVLDPSEGQKANFVFWCPEEFPSEIKITWDFWPVKEPGLCMLFFAAAGVNGESIMDKSLAPRNGVYKCYNDGDINTLHISYFRRNRNAEINLHTCNLRKSKGFNMVCQGADPIPEVHDCAPPYKMKLIKYKNEVEFYINQLKIMSWADDGITYGHVLRGGHIGLRQMAPLVAEYADFKVYTVE